MAEAGERWRRARLGLAGWLAVWIIFPAIHVVALFGIGIVLAYLLMVLSDLPDFRALGLTRSPAFPVFWVSLTHLVTASALLLGLAAGLFRWTQAFLRPRPGVHALDVHEVELDGRPRDRWTLVLLGLLPVGMLTLASAFVAVAGTLFTGRGHPLPLLGSGSIELVVSVVGTACLLALFGAISAIAGLRARAPALRLTPTGIQAIDAFGHVTVAGWREIEELRIDGPDVVLCTRDGVSRVGRVAGEVKAFVDETNGMVQRRRLPDGTHEDDGLRSIEAMRERPAPRKVPG